MKMELLQNSHRMLYHNIQSHRQLVKKVQQKTFYAKGIAGYRYPAFGLAYVPQAGRRLSSFRSSIKINAASF